MQCKSLDVCRGIMGLCVFTIMCVNACFFRSETVHLCVLKGEGVWPRETDTLATLVPL